MKNILLALFALLSLSAPAATMGPDGGPGLLIPGLIALDATNPELDADKLSAECSGCLPTVTYTSGLYISISGLGDAPGRCTCRPIAPGSSTQVCEPTWGSQETCNVWFKVGVVALGFGQDLCVEYNGQSQGCTMGSGGPYSVTWTGGTPCNLTGNWVIEIREGDFVVDRATVNLYCSGCSGDCPGV